MISPVFLSRTIPFTPNEPPRSWSSRRAKPQAEYDARIKEIATTGDRFVGQVYQELKGTR